MSTSKALVAPARKSRKRLDHELAFLPAALEIIETPPSPIGRAIGVTIIVLFCAALAWASMSKIDIIASAPGKIVPNGDTKIIQPVEIGIVRAIHVEDGQTVKAGDVLVELDPTVSQAELAQGNADLIAAETDVARLRAALSDAADPLTEFHPPADADPHLVTAESQLLISQVSEARAKVAEAESQRLEKEREVASIAAAMDKIQATIPMQQGRYDIRKYLADRGEASRILLLQDQEQLVSSQKELLVQKSHYAEAEAALAAITATGTKIQAEFRHGVSDDLTKAEQRVADLTQGRIKALQRTKQQTLIAPIDGVVQQLAVHTIGGVVTPAQPLLVLVPISSHLEIEAQISNQDIGFVEIGQPASIKVQTFDFTKYGLLHGTVESVSADAVQPDVAQQRANANSPDAARVNSQPNNSEPVYIGRISLDQNRMQIGDKDVSLSPGMAVTVEIKTGSRRIITYLLSPLMRYRQESLHER
ncbi:MAG TPA: HlyD family type I secretion periplasmic adaptor subunit [Stellaceae bacterium]|jgi:hemolysin D|nr:HlyD family type I secretion periplasmic adaptor subunit [Stellaceae bacterium]